MAAKTYYTILGVSENESPSGIRAAYRSKAKRLHPDVSGEEGTPRFQELAEAYSVLSDSGRRHRYNRELRRMEEAEAVAFRGRRPEPESIRPSHRATSRPLDPFDFELRMTPEEASRGVVLAADIPVLGPCPQCEGSAYGGVFPCFACGGHGLIESDATVRVRIPPRTEHGTIVEVPLAGLGIQLSFHVVVEAA